MSSQKIMEIMEITITRTDGNRTFGHIGSYDFEVRHYAQPSGFGIDEGRISKLWLGSRISYRAIAAYDRGWDVLPRTDDEIAAAQAIIDRFS